MNCYKHLLSIIVGPTVLLFQITSVIAQEDSGAQVIERSEPVKFVAHEEKYSTSIAGVNDFGEIKYLAEIRLVGFRIRNAVRARRSIVTTSTREWDVLLFGDQSGQVASGLGRAGGGSGRGSVELPDLKSRLLTVLDSDFVSPSLNREWKKQVEGIDCQFKLIRSNNAVGNDASVKIVLFSKSRESAQRNAKLLVQFADEIISMPLQKRFVDFMRDKKTALTELEAKLASQRETVEGMETKHKQLEQYSSEDAREFRNRLKLLEIDIVGQRAKLDACKRLLKEVREPQKRIQVENLKISSEVELAGLEATRRKIQELLDEVNHYEVSRRALAKAAASLRRDGGKVPMLRGDLSSLRDRLESYRPLTIAENEIGIYQVKWTTD